MDKQVERQRLGDRIRELREAKSFSQQDLADRAGMTRPYLSNLERGQSSPTVDLIVRIAKALDQTPSELLDHFELSDTELVPDLGYGLYPALQELLNDKEARILYNITAEEIEVLKSVRFLRQNFQPSKQFFLDVLLDLRRRKNR